MMLLFGPTFGRLCSALSPIGLNALIIDILVGLPLLLVLPRLRRIARWLLGAHRRADISACFTVRSRAFRILLVGGTLAPLILAVVTVYYLVDTGTSPDGGLRARRAGATAVLHILAFGALTLALFAAARLGPPLQRRPGKPLVPAAADQSCRAGAAERVAALGIRLALTAAGLLVVWSKINARCNTMFTMIDAGFSSAGRP